MPRLGPTFGRTAAIAAATLLGTALRLLGLRGQILVDDELHAVHAALRMPVSEILVTYQASDYCQPLTILYRFLMDRGVSLDETILRLPVLLSSVLTILVLPVLASRWISRRAVCLFAFLIALSPMLVLYGRMVRSYAPVVLIAGSAALLFFRWLERPRAGTGALYVLLACCATYFHLGAATFVLSPFLFAALEMTMKREARRHWVAVSSLAAFTLAGHVALVGLAWPTLGPLIASTRIEQSFRWEIAPPVAMMQAGSSHLLVTLLFWGLAAVGLRALLVRKKRLALFTVVVVAGHAAGLLVLSPWGLSSPQIFNRYLLVVLPILLMWVAVGTETVADRIRVGRESTLPWQLTSGALLGLIFLTGPLVEPRFRTSSFVHSHDLLSIFTEPARIAREDVPAFYRELPGQPAAGAILEYPHRTNTLIGRAIYVYQEIHQQPVLISTLNPRLRDPRLSLRGHVTPRPGDFLASDARYLVVHLDPGVEEASILETHWIEVFPMTERYWNHRRDAAARMTSRLRSLWGPPDVRDPKIRVWDLERIRRTAPPVPPTERSADSS